ncbi:protein S-acyltransferase 11 [Momordica charantia]|uniref:S-acyltransferase n=1 Tax=Momordica charantia TaxID=3673 RepID=A0A6J1DIB0_MOMCH|nr:protein S-acyltransferase 11 [Momordica charantia]
MDVITATPTVNPENMAEVHLPKEHVVALVAEDQEATCWGCGLHLLLPSGAAIFKCGWCGAITNRSAPKQEDKSLKWRWLRDRSFVCVLVLFMLFVICGGVWAVYPVVFSISQFCGIFHSTVTMVLAVTTISSFSVAAFRCPGMPPNVPWGSYPVVEKGDLENYTFCQYCSKPKSPRTHHCRSCGVCVLDMDHHCPFIGNCVGAGNHKHFILFLISTIVSTIYVSIMAVYSVLHMWPPLTFHELGRLNGFGTKFGWNLSKEIIHAVVRSTTLLSVRGFILIYLFISSFSVQIGLMVLLCQQLWYIYEGKTYLSHISSQGDDGDRDCRNLLRFFGCPSITFSRHLPIFRSSRKRHVK